MTYLESPTSPIRTSCSLQSTSPEKQRRNPREPTQIERELETMRRRDAELTTLFKRLYEDNVLGKITNEVFRKLSDYYFAEQKEIQSSIPERKERLETLKSSLTNVSVFPEKAKQYTHLDTLTAELLHLFIEKIVVAERGKKWSRTAAQEIHIYYRNIGLPGDLMEQTTDNATAQQPQEVRIKGNWRTAHMHCLPIYPAH